MPDRGPLRQPSSPGDGRAARGRGAGRLPGPRGSLASVQSPPHRYYGSEVSYFTAKGRAALRAKRIFFDEVLATPRVYREVILPRTGLAFIPVLVTADGRTVQDTSEICDWLEWEAPVPGLLPKSPVQRFVAYLWELYADEFLILPALHYRWSYPESAWKARRDFAATTGDPERAERFADRIVQGTRAMGIDERTGPALEAHTETLLERLEAHWAEHDFLLGGAPSLADCALMGPLYPHLYLDAVPGRLLRGEAIRTCHWIERMNHPDVERYGPWLEADGLAPTLRPLLEGIGEDAVPLVLAAVRAFDAWADAEGEPGATPPRFAGRHEATLRGVRFERATSPYTLWMLQRVREAYLGLGEEERADVRAALEGTGCEALLDAAPRHRVEKRAFQLVLDPEG